jgi:hypothetical protein
VSKVHRRILLASELRCSPHPDCHLKATCSRFTSPIPQGSASLANLRPPGVGTVMSCIHYLSAMVGDDEDKPETKEVKPWPFHYF